jgi:hypothetical protein
MTAAVTLLSKSSVCLCNRATGISHARARSSAGLAADAENAQQQKGTETEQSKKIRLSPRLPRRGTGGSLCPHPLAVAADEPSPLAVEAMGIMSGRFWSELERSAKMGDPDPRFRGWRRPDPDGAPSRPI